MDAVSSIFHDSDLRLNNTDLRAKGDYVFFLFKEKWIMIYMSMHLFPSGSMAARVKCK